MTALMRVKCRCTLQGFTDHDVLELVRDRKTDSSTLSTNIQSDDFDRRRDRLVSFCFDRDRETCKADVSAG